MKRDMDTVRRILLAVEDASAPVEQLDDCDDAVFSYHVAILIESGLVRGDVSDYGDTLQPFGGSIFRLTWSGHEFLDAARNESVWQNTTATVRSKGLSLTFDVLKELLTATVRGQLGLC
jgi:hypothetical protein